jgi:hypothetical protein
MARSNPHARPYTAGGTISANRALRAGRRSPRAAQAPARSTATCQTVVAAPMRLERTAVVV